MRCHGEMWAFLVLPMGWSYSPRIAQSYAWAALLSLASDENGLARSTAEFLAQRPEHPPSFLLLHDKSGNAVGLILIWYDNFLAWSTDGEIMRHMSCTWAEMTARWGLVWGEKKLWHPKHLEASIADANPEAGVSLGIQFEEDQAH